MSGPKVEIVSREFKAFKGVSAGSNKPYDMARQEGYLHAAGKYPEKMEIPLQDKDANGNWIPYNEGFYTFTPDSYHVKDGRAAINQYDMRLVALIEAARVKAA